MNTGVRSLINLVFTKDRPLQLHGYLASLRATGWSAGSLVVLPRLTSEYAEVLAEFGARWMEENGDFDAAVRNAVASLSQPYVLFGCDDCVWVSAPDFAAAAAELSADPQLFAYSFRLGPRFGRRWCSADHSPSSHYGYPFELMGTLYRSQDVRAFLSSCGRLECPNDLEAWGNSHFSAEPRHMACGPRIHLVAHQVNRVQNKYPNGVTSQQWTAAACLEAWRSGKRMRIDHTWGQGFSEPFVAADYFELI